MRLLLDTHIVLWTLSGDRPLSGDARTAIDAADQLWFSVVSFAEMGVKAAIGKLDLPGQLPHRVRAAGLRILPLEVSHALAVADLPLYHRDPFDRLLVAQARAERLHLVTADARMAAYDVDLVDAR